MMTFTQVFDISVTITNDSLAQGYPHLNNLTSQSLDQNIIN